MGLCTELNGGIALRGEHFVESEVVRILPRASSCIRSTGSRHTQC
jgi:hypothetical protein